MRIMISLVMAGLILGMAGNTTAEDRRDSTSFSAANISRATRDQETRILHSLSQRIHIKATDEPLENVVQQIAQEIGRTIHLDRKALLEQGISPDELVSLNLGELNVLQAFYFLLYRLELTWVAEDGVLEITTLDRAFERQVIRVHDVKNTCEILSPLLKGMNIKPRTSSGRLGGSGTGGARMAPPAGGGMFSLPVRQTAIAMMGQLIDDSSIDLSDRPQLARLNSPSAEEWLARVIELIPSSRWKNQDGEGGAIQWCKGSLIVSQTEQMQLEISGLLRAIDRLVSNQAAGKSINATRLGYLADQDNELFEILSRPANLELFDESIRDVLQRIAKEHNFKLLINDTAVEDEGLSLDRVVNLQIPKLPLGASLKRMLAPFELTCVVREGVLIVTTPSAADEMLSIRLYDVSRCRGVRADDPEHGWHAILTDLTQGRWLDQDGEGGSAMLISPRHLFVSQTEAVHAEIELLIDDLSRDDAAQPLERPLIRKIYSAADVPSAKDLKGLMPQLIPLWNDGGTPLGVEIHQVGRSLMITHTSQVHDQIEELMAVLADSEERNKQPSAVESDADEKIDDK